MASYPLQMGCTKWQHRLIGIDAVVNARAGLQHLNFDTLDDVEQWRDGEAIKARIESRVRWYGPHSKFFRRNRKRIAHLIASRGDE